MKIDMKALKSVLLILCFFFCQNTLFAQEAKDTTKLFETIKQLQDLYKQKAVSFDIRYTYTSEHNPEKELDSLIGHMDLSGNNYHYLLSETEMTANERYVITLFAEDKIMYLSKPFSGGAVDPMTQMWAAMKTAGLTSCIFSETVRTRSLSIDFKAGGPYKKMELVFDKKSGYLNEMKYVLRTEMLMSSGEGIENIVAEYGEYAIVKCKYSNYKALVPDADMFDERKFFYKDGETFMPTARYNEYKVFQGSPGL